MGVQTHAPVAAFHFDLRTKIILAMLAVYTIWGSTYLAVLIGLESFGPFMLNGLRFGVTGTVMFVVLALRGTPLPTRVQWRNAFMIGMIMLGVGTGGVSLAESVGVASGLASLMVAAVPLWAGVFAVRFGHAPNRLEWLGIVIGLAGVALLNLEKGMQGSPLGAAALILGPICWALGSLWMRHLNMPSGLMSPATQMIGGGLLMSVVSFVTGERLSGWPDLDSVLAVVYLMVFGSLIAFNAYQFLIQTVRPALATSYAYVNPVVAVLLGVVFAAETISGVGLLAMAVILGGVVLVVVARDLAQKRIKA